MKAIEAIPAAMAASLIRTAYSSIVREARDIATGLFDTAGRSVVQSEYIPILVASLQPALEAVLSKHPPSTWRPGDCVLTNDPFDGGQHLNDIAAFTPIFEEDELLGFAGSIAHHLDLGGITPGIMNGATEVFHEGIVIPAIKLTLEEGMIAGPMLEILTANSRAPEELSEDLTTQLAANYSANARIRELVRLHGTDMLLHAMRHMQEHAARLMDAALTAFPIGTFAAEALVDNDGAGSGPLTIRAALHFDGSTLSVNFSGSAPQAGGMVNSTRASTLAAVHTAILQYLSEPERRLPANHGTFGRVRVDIPSGSVLDPNSPASVHARYISAYRAYEAVAAALSQALPHKAQATGFNGTAVFAISRLESGRYSILADIACGGWGATPDRNGADGTPSPLSNCSNVPAEWLEYRFPHLRLRRYEFLDGSGGEGKRHGGRGEIREFEILADGLQFTAMCDRFLEGAPGIEGGLSAAPGYYRVLREGEVVSLPSLCQFELRAGDILQIATGGGGGYGPPTRQPISATKPDAASACD